jgi:hypothetical protein
MSRYGNKGVALPITLFFVMVAFFAASALLTRAHFEAQATVLEANGIQQEALARAALSTLQARLEHTTDEEAMEQVVLQGPGGFQATTWFEVEDNSVYRLFARVESGTTQPFVAQRVVKKRPVLNPLDVAHLTDGDIDTADGVKLRLAGSDVWRPISAPRKSLLWLQVDRRGGISATHFPVLTGDVASPLSPDDLEEFLENNNSLIQNGEVGFDFFERVAQAIDENSSVDLAAHNMGIGLNAANNNVNVNTNNSNSNNHNQGGLVFTASEIVEAVVVGSSIQHYSTERGTWSTIDLAMPDGQLPGPTASDGKKLYLPVLKPGADRLMSYDLEQGAWAELSAPPATVRDSAGRMSYTSGETHRLVDVEVDDDGFVYAKHGDGDGYALSRLNPDTGSWEQLPSPPQVVVNTNGQTELGSQPAQDWGSLEVDDQGDIYVVWRSPEDDRGDGIGMTGTDIGPGSGQLTGPSLTGIVGPGSGQLTGGPGLTVATTASQAQSSGAPANTVVPTNTTGLDTVTVGGPSGGTGQAEDTVLRLCDGEWQILTPEVSSGTIGGLSTSTEGRLVMPLLKRGDIPDTLYVLDRDGAVSGSSTVPDLDGSDALYFAADSGAEPVPGKFRFLETAEY